MNNRRISSGGLTPNVATPSVDPSTARRGSLRDLNSERDITTVIKAHQRDLTSKGQCTYKAIRDRLLATPVSALPHTIPEGVTVKTLDGSYDPVHAFDELITQNLEAVPVTTCNNHTHNLDGTITILSSHPLFQNLSKLAKDPHVNTTPQKGAAPTTPSSPAAGENSPALGANVTPSSPKPLSLSLKANVEQCLIIDPAQPGVVTMTTRPASTYPHSTGSAIPSFGLPQTPSSGSQASPRPSNGDKPAHGTPEIPNNLTQHLPCPEGCDYRQAVGWLDIRDLASCIVYVYQQPVNEDALEYREGGHGVVENFQIQTRGLDGITDLPGLTSSASFGSLSNHSSNSDVIQEEPDELGTPSALMGIVYENDEAKGQGQVLKQQQQATGRYQGFSHRLSLAPMTEECEDNFDMSTLTALQNQLGTPVAAEVTTVGQSSPSSSSSRHSDFSFQNNQPRSRSESRRRRMLKPEELSADLTAGGQQAWLNTLKTGLGKFSHVSNISTQYLARRHQVRSVKPESSLLEICQTLSQRGTHRMAVIPATSCKIDDIVSHRTLIKYFWENRDTIFALDGQSNTIEEDGKEEDGEEVVVSKNLLEKLLDNLTIGTPNISHIRNDILGLDALQEMDENNRTGLAVVDDNGRLVGATSARTIKRITKHRDHATMSSNLVQFITEPAEQEHEEDDKCMVANGAVVLLDEDLTLGDVLEAMYKHNTNRVFLVDDSSYPTKVISFADILQLMIY